jgi:hypothetical protein
MQLGAFERMCRCAAPRAAAAKGVRHGMPAQETTLLRFSNWLTKDFERFMSTLLRQLATWLRPKIWLLGFNN